jgi:hypothetical protein
VTGLPSGETSRASTGLSGGGSDAERTWDPVPSI